MSRINTDAIADLFFQINWNSQNVQHTDAYAGRRVNFWRDRMPRRLIDILLNKQSGDQVRLSLSPGELMETPDVPDLRMLSRHQFDTARMGIGPKSPRQGRFYPKGVLKDVSGIFRANTEPFRCLQVYNGKMETDMGHPLARHPLELNVTVGSLHEKSDERGGSVIDWGDTITEGVGMQSRWQDDPTDFFKNAPFGREDESDDKAFYAQPRLVQHIDDTAIDLLKAFYGRFLSDGLNVLDLMASWQSHLPEGLNPIKLNGLGLNEKELQHNPALSDYQIQDLNKWPLLPYLDATYDVVLCSLSVEYLVHPRLIFKEVARVLRPGGSFVVTFSNRWFDTKAVRIWSELHEFERLGMVLEYFQRDDLFDQLHTYSVRGLRRPSHDKYFGKLPYADPLYAVWGSRV